MERKGVWMSYVEVIRGLSEKKIKMMHFLLCRARTCTCKKHLFNLTVAEGCFPSFSFSTLKPFFHSASHSHYKRFVIS